MTRNQIPTVDLGSGENLYRNEYKAAMYQCVKEGMQEIYNVSGAAVGLGAVSVALFFFAPMSTVNLAAMAGSGIASAYCVKKVIDMLGSKPDFKQWLTKNPDKISPEAKLFLVGISEERSKAVCEALVAGANEAIREDLNNPGIGKPRAAKAFCSEVQVQAEVPVARVVMGEEIASTQAVVPVAEGVPNTQAQGQQATQLRNRNQGNNIGNGNLRV